MGATRRIRPALVAVAASAVTALAGGMAAAGASAHAQAAGAGGPSVKRFSLSGYVINTQYTLGRNRGNTFEQTYKKSTVHGVPIKGPSVGVKFPVEDYVAMPIGNHEIYVAWQDTKTHALLDVYVMNFSTHVVFDYAPGSAHPESSGTIKVIKVGANQVP
jgi:hypothetical protein